MTLQNGSNVVLQKLSQGSHEWLIQQGLNPADPTADIVTSDPGYVIPLNQGHTFADYKAEGLSDDDAMAKAIANGGTLVINAGLSIHLTRTFTITKPTQIISEASSISGGTVITSSSIGGTFRIQQGSGPVLFQGLNIINTAGCGSIIILSDDHSAVRDCQFANVAGNSSSMVKFQGFDQEIENSTFANYEPTAYSWDATWVDGYDGADGEPVNDRVVGGSAFGPGKGGLIANAGLHFPEGISIDDWTCATQGTQIEASDVYSLEIRGGVYSGATGSAIVLGGGNALVQSVTIQGVCISAAGTAINASPTSGSGINDLTIQDNQIGGSGNGVTVNGHAGHLSILGNTITSSILGLSILNPASQVTVIDNTISGGGVSIADNAAGSSQVYFGNTINGTLTTAGSTLVNVTFTSNEGTAAYYSSKQVPLQPLAAQASNSVIQAVQKASNNVQLPNFTTDAITPSSGTFTAAAATDTFLHFKDPSPGVVLTDDQAFAAAIAQLGPTHGTLVIDDGITITLTTTVNVSNSMTIIAAGSGLDTSSLITSTSSSDMFHVSASGPVVIQGLNFAAGSAGSIVTTGAGNTVLRDDKFTNVAGNGSPMVVLQGPDQLIKDSYFENSEATAYDWSASYINPGMPSDISTTISGGWAHGNGKGGLIGGSGPVIQGFNIFNWTIVGEGATQVEADNVATLDVEGGVFDWSAGSAIVLGGGTSRINSVTVNGAYISAAGAYTSNSTTGTGINADLTTGGGVANLTITDNQINDAGTGVLVGAQVGNVTVSGNDLRTGKVGLDLTDPSGTVTVVGNQVNQDGGALAVKSTGASGLPQYWVGNTFNGPIAISDVTGPSPTFIDNIGSAAYVDTSGVALQAKGIASTTVSLAQLAAIPPVVVTALTALEVAALTATQVAQLTITQVGALTATQIGVLSAMEVGALTTTQVGALTTAQLQALSPIQMVGFTPMQLAVLDTSRLVTLMTSQFGRDYIFDSTYYLAENPDVAAAGVDPYQHYLTFGWKEGRNPSALFNTNFYLDENPTVRAAGVNPLAQFEISGWNNGTDPSAIFSDSKYLAANPDVAAAKMDPLLHYIISGQYEGRVTYAVDLPDPLIDASYVLLHNPSVNSASLDALEWFDNVGWKQGANPDAWFDTNYYLAHNPDVKASGANPLQQFEAEGWKTGANPSAAFSTDDYLNANPDVAAAGMDPLLHYVEYGIKEGRSLGVAQPADPLVDASYVYAHNPSVAAAGVEASEWYDTNGWKQGANPNAWFDTNYYLTQNPDVKAAGLDPLTHFETWGWREGRNPSLVFSDAKYLLANQDVEAANMDPLQHYLSYGQSEGRMTFLPGGSAPTVPLIDANYYDAQLGATLIPLGNAAVQQAASDYENRGWQVGLSPNAYFDTKYYLTHNPDVAAAHVDPLLHYETFGWMEGRDPSAAFSTDKFLAAYQDVAGMHIDPLLQFVTANQNGIYHAISV